MGKEPSICAGFPAKTSWTLVGQAGTGAEDALTTLLRIYQPALLAHLIVRKKWSRHNAEDLVQSFIADKIIARCLFAQAERERGKFRTFLLTALDHYATDARDAQMAKKRSPERRRIVPIDDVSDIAEDSSSLEYDVEWARDLLAQVLAHMQAECEASHAGPTFRVFEDRILKPLLGGAEPVPFGTLRVSIGFSSTKQVYNALTNAKRMFDRHLRVVIAQYIGHDTKEIEREISSLCGILWRAGG